MSLILKEAVIKQLCGRFAYESGEALYQDGSVTFMVYDAKEHRYEANVHHLVPQHVTVARNAQRAIVATCTCPAFYPDDLYCEHIAAVLVYIEQVQNGEQTMPIQTNDASFDPGLAGDILSLFAAKPARSSRTWHLFDARAPLTMEFILKPQLGADHRMLLAIELRAGLKRTYTVQPIRSFLHGIERGETFALSKSLRYDPEQHRFLREHDAILQQLIRIHRNETMLAAPMRKPGSDRLLLIPPSSWGDLLPLLEQATSVKLDTNELAGSDTSFYVEDERPPLYFELDELEDQSGYSLLVHGLETVTVLEAYGLVLAQGKLLRVSTDSCARLAAMKQLLQTADHSRIFISAEHIQLYLEKVVPGLAQLGSVRIADAIAARLMQPPLQARLYLDRVRDRLLAGLEFQYGDIVLNPLEPTVAASQADRILMRNTDLEEQILELMDSSFVIKTESGFFLDDEEAEYHFMYHILPQLEKLLHVYATSAVKSRLFTVLAPPKVIVNIDEKTDWLAVTFDIEGIPESEIRSLLQALHEKRKYHKLSNGALMPLERAEFQEIIRFINETGIRLSELKGNHLQLPLSRALPLAGTDYQGHAITLGKSLRRMLEHVRNPDHLDFPVPDSLSDVLRDYQLYGYQWLKMLAFYRFGGILADDMGLGKTLQSIAFLVSMQDEIRQHKRPALIVAPSSLLYNWQHELLKFAPQLRVVIADGSRQERVRVLKGSSQMDVLITSYPLLRRDLDLYVQPTFHTLILDEAQVFKNHVTQTAQAVKSIQATYRFALTGTPIENRLEELWSIFDAVFPGLLPERQAFGELSREAIAKRVRPFVLRRLKTDVLKELPEKIESLHPSELLPEQKRLYAAYLAKLQKEAMKHLIDNDFQQNRIKILAGLTRLRQLCCHPALFVEGYQGGSGKLDQLLEIIEECRSAGKRALIFSQFTEMLGLIRRELGERGVPLFYLDGQTPAAERVELCDRFNRGERDMFLLSLKAGGTGLNLTGADTVILYDLWWNPAVEQQAADRAHRIGQKNVVQVIRLVAQGTIEDTMYELQKKKRNLIDDVIQSGQEALATLTEQDIREILSIG
ncbi:DEAD/DEAH box helicase [Paenibacillus aestuarii]|uniref:SNF2 helicase associated domain-containing protein n=1 Tax=Paenibacillus aestuarii TaxID=516965 RepID=A0ABW0KEC7_9BACL|nr:DEAD/DEAH box helicase [Paenibacillus aestuarii]